MDKYFYGKNLHETGNFSPYLFYSCSIDKVDPFFVFYLCLDSFESPYTVVTA